MTALQTYPSHRDSDVTTLLMYNRVLLFIGTEGRPKQGFTRLTTVLVRMPVSARVPWL